MIDLSAQARIRELYVRGHRSLLQYVSQSSPWHDEARRPVVEKLDQLAAEEAQALADFAVWMEEQGIPLPYLGAFPSRYTCYNFVDVRSLISPLIADQRAEVDAMAADAGQLSPDQGRNRVAMLVDLFRRHLDELDQLKK